jgi:hypothetical protein
VALEPFGVVAFAAVGLAEALLCGAAAAKESGAAWTEPLELGETVGWGCAAFCAAAVCD